MDRMYKKIGRRLLSLVLVTSMLLTGSYFGSMVGETEQSGTGNFFVSPDDNEGLLEKTAIPVAGEEGQYDISLTLKPPKSSMGTITKTTDIVLVIDRSGSMGSGWGNNNIMGDVRNAAVGLVNTVLADGVKGVRVAAVSFSGEGDGDMAEDTSFQSFSNSASTVNTFIQGITAGGGTNTEAGFKKAYQLLEGSAAEQKFVVFFSDGGPTFRLTSVKEEVWVGGLFGGGEWVNYNYGTGSSDSSGINADCALAWADLLKARPDQTTSRFVTGTDDSTAWVYQNQKGRAATIFTVGYNQDLSGYGTPGDEYNYNISNPNQINGIFQKIQSTIVTNRTVQDVVLEDIVTDQFEILSLPAGVQVEGQEIPLGSEIAINGQKVTVPLGEISSTLEGDKVITVTFRIQLKEGIIQEAGTYELPTNTAAKVTYKENGEIFYQIFEVPSVQVEVLSPGELLDMSKDAQLVDWINRIYNITLSAEAKTSTTETEAESRDIVLVLDKSGSMAWGASENSTINGKRVGTFSQVKNTLDTTKQYYYYTNTSSWSNPGNSSPNANRMEYRNGKWQKRSQSGNNWSDVEDGDVVYIRNDRLCQLKDAVNSFIDQVAAKSPNSRIAVIYFASDAENSSNGFRILNSSDNINALKTAVNGARATGGTYLGDGLELINENLFTAAPATGDRKRMVVTFTDGAYNGNPKTQADTLKGTKAAEIYCVGLYLTTSAEQNLRDNVASPTQAGDEVDHVLTTADASSLTELFNKITSTIGGTVEGVTITDVLDSRFELTAEERNRLEASGVAVTVVDGVTTIVWENQTVKTGAEKWTRTIQVKAKDDFLGGNNISTNDQPKSGVTIDGVFEAFPDQPEVNVRIDLTMGNAYEKIFLGESAPAPVAKEAEMKNSTDNRIVYTWNVDKDAVITPDKTGIYTYTLTGAIKSEVSGAQAKESCTIDGKLYENSTYLNAVGTYTVEVIAGSLTINKTLTSDTPVDTATPFVFKIERRETTNGPVIETFYRTIYTGENKLGGITIDGLKKGHYTVTEQTDWSWKYSLVSSTGTQGTLGMENGYTDTAISVAFANKKVKDNWYGATDGVVNVFTEQEG